MQLTPNEHQKRPKIRLGKVTNREAENARLNIEQLIKAKVIRGVLTSAIATWLVNLTSPFRKKLEKISLVELQEACERFLVKEWALAILRAEMTLNCLHRANGGILETS